MCAARHKLQHTVGPHTSTPSFLIMDLTEVLLFITTFMCAMLLIKRLTSKKYNLPPGPPALPVIGNLVQMASRAKDLHIYTLELKKKYGPIFMLKMGDIKMVFLTSRKLIKESIVDQADLFTNRPHMYINELTGQTRGGPILMNGENWKKIRRFGLTNMRDFGVGKKSVEGKIIEEVAHLMKVFNSHVGQPFDCMRVVNNAVSNVICSVCFGQRFDYDDKQFEELLGLLNHVVRNGDVAIRDPANLWSIFRVLPVRKTTQEIVDVFFKVDEWILNIIKNRRETFDPESINDLVDVYLLNETKSEEKINDFEMQRLIFDLFTAGSETTSTTLMWGLLYMLKYPAVQKKCYEEIERTVGQERQITYKDKTDLPYIEATMAEIQRMANITAIGVQHDTKEDAKLGGYDIPAGTMIQPCQYAIHLDDDVFDNAQTFDPSRFIDSDGKFFRHEHLIPFGTGPRVCMGESLARTEMFIIFASLMQKFRFEKETPDTELDTKGIFGFTLSPLPFKVKPVLR